MATEIWVMLGIFSLISTICHKLIWFYRNAVLVHIIFVVTPGEIFGHLGHMGTFHPIHYNVCNYLSMLGLKLNHVSKRGHRRQPQSISTSLNCKWIEYFAFALLWNFWLVHIILSLPSWSYCLSVTQFPWWFIGKSHIFSPLKSPPGELNHYLKHCLGIQKSVIQTHTYVDFIPW